MAKALSATSTLAAALLFMHGCASEEDPYGPQEGPYGAVQSADASIAALLQDAGSQKPPDAAAIPTASGLPCDVSRFLTTNCTSCHGQPPLPNVPFPLVTYQNLTAAANGQTVAQRALAEVQSGAMPPGRRLTSTEIAPLAAWVQAGAPSQACGTAPVPDASVAPSDAGVVISGDGGSPYDTPSKCTSNARWFLGDVGSSQMHPGRACISCHSMRRGPSFSAAGTVYPSAHEPDDCNGQNGSGVVIKLKGANGQVVSFTPNSVGNFSGTASINKPYTAEITYQGRTRAMVTPQTSGDCNSCHTEQGTNGAPGRLMLP